jgi:hypothetical protein
MKTSLVTLKFWLLAYFLLILPKVNLLALVESKLGKIEAIGTLSAEYDSKAFGISSTAFSGAKSNSSIPNNELKSEDDFIISFSPALHYSKTLKWFTFTGTAGIALVQYIKNDDKSYTQPITTFSIDFDETLSKSKRISNNAKIRFDATFDLGQSVGASVLDQDLTSYTFFDVGLNLRYNHSPKFGIGASTSYNLKDYQSGAVQEQPYQDLSTLPLSLRAFYIYSEKLDFYSDYTLTRTKGGHNGALTLTDSQSHAFSIGAQGDYSSKLSGNANIGYSTLNFDNSSASKQDNLISQIGIKWTLNPKSSFNFDLSRTFSPSAQGFSTFGTSFRVTASHRMTEKITASAYLSLAAIDYTHPPKSSGSLQDATSLNQYGMGMSLQKAITARISASGGYDYSYIDRSVENYGRHVLRAELTGRF